MPGGVPAVSKNCAGVWKNGGRRDIVVLWESSLGICRVVGAAAKQRIDVRIDNYRIENEIGRGGIATVYLAIQKSLGRKVALKIMSPALAAEPNFTERFIREGRTVAQLTHPNIVTIHDIGVSDYHHYIAMEYVEGGNLPQYMQDKPNPLWCLTVIRQVASALGYAHAQGFVHRDVKPENVLFRNNGTAVLTDFGIAKSIESEAQLTTIGTIVGTPRYMSPEQADGRGTDPRSDIYALGVILFEMLAGHPPYQGPDSMSTLYAHVHEPIPSLPLPMQPLQPLVDSMLAKRAQDRVPDCKTLVNIIRLVLRDGKVPILPDTSRTPLSALPDISGADDIVGSGSRRAPGKERRRRMWRAQTDDDLSSPAVLVRRALAAAVPVTVLIALVYAITPDTRLVSEVDTVQPVSIPSPQTVSTPSVTLPQETFAEASPPPMVTFLYEPPTVKSEEGRAIRRRVEPQTPTLDQAQIDRLIAQARRQVEREQLAHPAGDNALETYQTVLEAAPDDERAKHGLEGLAAQHLKLARQESSANDFGKALLYAERGLAAIPNHRNLQSLKDLAEKNLDAEASFGRAETYYYGRGVRVDYARAVEWYQRAALNGHAEAQFSLAVSYANGQGIAQNESAALQWFRRAAVQGDLEAQYFLGLGLLFGEFPDPDEAANWIQRVAESKYAPSYRVLSWLYTTGTGTPQSIKESIRWSVKGAVKGSGRDPDRKAVGRWEIQFKEASSSETVPDPDRP